MAETFELQGAGLSWDLRIDPQGIDKLEDALEVMAQGFMRLTDVLLQTVQAAGLLTDRLVALAGMPAATPARRDSGAESGGDSKPEPKSVAKPLAEVRALRDMAQAYGQESVANDAQAVMNSLSDIGRTADGIILQVSGVFFEKLKGPLEEFAKWFDTHGPLIGKRLAEVAGAALNMALVIAPVLGWIGSLFLDLDAATGGWSTRILIAVTAFRMLGGADLVNGLVALANAIGLVNAASGGLGNLGGMLSGVGLGGKVGRAGLAVGLGLEVARMLGVPDTDVAVGEQAVRDGEWFKAASYLPAGDLFSAIWGSWFGDDKPEAAAEGAAADPQQGAAPGSGALPGIEAASLPPGNDALLAAAQAPRLTSQQMLDNANRSAAQAGEQFRSMMQDLPDTRRDVVSADGGSASLRLPAFGEPMPQSLSAPWDGYRSGALELKLNVESPQVNLTATTTIYVEGSADPMATATAVAGQQDRVFADLTRNTQGAYL